MADINKNEANITVKFISEQVNLLKNSKGEVIEGDPNFIETVTDVWTFTKNLKNFDPTWALSSTKNA
jgi:predicted lipid-binding transport protein (Tim44 family)